MDASRLERSVRNALPCLEQMDPPCDGVRWHHAREIRSALDAAPAPAQAWEAVAYEIIDAAGRHVAVRRTLQAAKSWVRAGTGWTVRPLVPAPSSPGGA